MEGVLVHPPTGIPCSQQAKSTDAGHDPYGLGTLGNSCSLSQAMEALCLKLDPKLHSE